MRIGPKTLLALTASLLLFPAALPQQTQPLSQPLADTQHPIKARVIVFVHGIHGSRETWRAPNGAYWPDMVRTDPHFAYSDVDVAVYPTPSSNGKMTSEQLSDVLWASLKKDHVWEHREVVFLAHSLGGILVEEMLLRHPAEAARVKFIVSYGTPHEGSPVARIASLYDKDPLLLDLKDGSDNSVLTNLERNWRAQATVNGIHRFCAYEALDTMPESGVGRYLKTHTRVVSYFSATYGCDVTTPPQEIPTDHIGLVRPRDRNAPAYDFFLRVYRDNPVLDERVVRRDTTIAGLEAGCDRTNASPDLEVPVALDVSLRERVTAASAALVATENIRDIHPNPPIVTRVDANGVAHVDYGFAGPGKKLLLCLGTGHASLQVEFTIDQQVPLREP
jgi:pimeloyl-ACP methyl ester carboxylesterase